MSTVSDVSPAEWELWRNYFRASHELIASLDRRLQHDAGISHPEYLLMMSLWRSPDHSLRTGELAEELSWEKSRVSHLVTRMEARKLVERRECETDARGVWVVLSTEGRRTFLRATRDHSEAIREWFFDILSDEEKLVLGTVAKRMRDTLGTACADAQEPASA